MRGPNVPAQSPTLGLSHLQFEAMLSAARLSGNQFDFALLCLLGLLGLRIFEATGSDIADLGEEHSHRVLRVLGKGGKVVLVPLSPAVGRAVDRAIADRTVGPILLNRHGTRMDRHTATPRAGGFAGGDLRGGGHVVLRFLGRSPGATPLTPPPRTGGSGSDRSREEKFDGSMRGDAASGRAGAGPGRDAGAASPVGYALDEGAAEHTNVLCLAQDADRAVAR